MPDPAVPNPPAAEPADPTAASRVPAPALPNRLATVMIFNLLIPVAVLALFKAFGDYQTVFDQTYGRLERWTGTLGDVWDSAEQRGAPAGAIGSRETALRLRNTVHKLMLESRNEGPTVAGAALLSADGRVQATVGDMSAETVSTAVAFALDRLKGAGDPRAGWSERGDAGDGGETFTVVRPAAGSTQADRSYLLTVFDSTGVRARFRHRLTWLFAMDAGLAVLVGVLAYLLVYRFVLRPVQVLHRGARQIAEGRLDHRLDLNSPDELGLLAGEFNAMAERLQADYRELEEYNRRLKADREAAGQLQRRLLPASLPQVEGFEFSVSYHPCEDVGGDFYDVFRLDDGRTALYVADVAGHGVGAALITVFIRQTIAHLRAVRPEVLGRPRDALTLLRARFVAESFGTVFVSMIYGVLDAATGRFCFADAGHPLPVVADGEGRVREAQDLTGPVITDMLPEMPFPEQELTLPPGSRLLLYTDGAADALTADGRPFGAARLCRLLADGGSLSGSEWTRRAAEAIRGHVAGRPLIDDVTLLTVTAVGRPAAGRRSMPAVAAADSP